jgi:hypothetical protein
MKLIHTLALLMLLASLADSQSSIVSDADADIDVGVGTEISADTIVIGGTFSGTGTLATVASAGSNRWNMVSVPLTVSDYTKTHLYPTAISNAFAFEGSYVVKSTLANGIGYWLKFDGDQQVPVTGFVRTQDTIDVLEAWNLVGSISQSISTSQITSIPPGLITSEFFAYRGSYVASDTIEPGQACWVKVSQKGKLVLSSSAEASPDGGIRMLSTNEMPPPAPTDANIEPARGGQASNIPKEFALDQNYPNPFNPVTVIRYQLPVSSFVTLKVYDALGQELAGLVDGMQAAGYKSVRWDASAQPSGVYFYRMVAGSFTEMSKMIILK